MPAVHVGVSLCCVGSRRREHCLPACLPQPCERCNTPLLLHRLLLQTLAAAQHGSGGRRGAARAGAQTGWQRKGARLVEAAGLSDEQQLGVGNSSSSGGSSSNGGSNSSSREYAPATGDVDLPRLYEHFLYAMAHKGQPAGKRLGLPPCSG
jgi:hypothetical protein